LKTEIFLQKGLDSQTVDLPIEVGQAPVRQAGRRDTLMVGMDNPKLQFDIHTSLSCFGGSEELNPDNKLLSSILETSDTPNYGRPDS
jgi:hypothetical protein